MRSRYVPSADPLYFSSSTLPETASAAPEMRSPKLVFPGTLPFACSMPVSFFASAAYRIGLVR